MEAVDIVVVVVVVRLLVGCRCKSSGEAGVDGKSRSWMGLVG